MTPEEYQVYREAFYNKQPNKSRNFVYYRLVFGLLCLIGILGFLFHSFSYTLQPTKVASESVAQYVAKEGYAFTYPASWKVSEGRNSVIISSNPQYFSGASPTLSQSDIVAQWSVEENIPQMAQNGDAQAAPLIADEYLQINGVSAFRQVKQGEDGNTKVIYQLLKDNTVYRFTCEVANNDPQELTKTCDAIAKSFNFAK